MIIGLMGGVGSGKSTVLNYLRDQYNAEIIQSDMVAKEVMKPGFEAFNEIKQAFPDVISDNAINNNRLAGIVFNDKEKLKQLNSITHPATVKEIISRINSSSKNIIVVESAILPGSGLEEICDELWFVFCEKETRIKRLMDSRGYTRENALNIINNQPTDEEYNTISDEFIDNSYSENKTREHIDYILSLREC